MSLLSSTKVTKVKLVKTFPKYYTVQFIPNIMNTLKHCFGMQ